MKYELLLVVVATICGAFASPLAEKPETKVSSSVVQVNLTISTVAYVTAQQIISHALLALNLNSNPTILAQYSWFLLNYMNGGIQLSLINYALTACVGSTCKTTITNALNAIITTLQQANQYFSGMNSTASAQMTIQINAIISLQTQITAALSCMNSFQSAKYSCPDSLFTLMAQFAYQSASVMTQITTGWSKCSNDPTKCALATTTTTTTTPTTTTTTTTPTTTTTTESPYALYFSNFLQNLAMTTMDASLCLSASFWELNINSFSAAISGPYYFFVENLGMAFSEGSKMYNAMSLLGSEGYTTIESSCMSLIAIIQQANEFIMYIDAAAYAEISMQIEVLKSMQMEICGELRQCKSDLFVLSVSCGDGPYKKMADFVKLFITLFVRIITLWCNICSVMPDFCENPFTTTTESSTSESTTESSTESTTESTSEFSTESTSEFSTESTSEFSTESTSESSTDSTSESSSTESTTESTTESSTESTSESSTESTSEFTFSSSTEVPDQ